MPILVMLVIVGVLCNSCRSCAKGERKNDKFFVHSWFKNRLEIFGILDGIGSRKFPGWLALLCHRSE